MKWLFYSRWEVEYPFPGVGVLYVSFAMNILLSQLAITPSALFWWAGFVTDNKGADITFMHSFEVVGSQMEVLPKDDSKHSFVPLLWDQQPLSSQEDAAVLHMSHLPNTQQ